MEKMEKFENSGESVAHVGMPMSERSLSLPSLERIEFDYDVEAEYKSNTLKAHRGLIEFINPLVNSGKLPQEYKLPALAEFTEQVEALRSSYEEWTINNWNPKLILVPNGLSPKGWRTLLSEHDIWKRYPGGRTFNTERKTNGVWCDYADEVLAPSNTENPWYAAIISGLSRPAFVNVSPDGTRGFNLQTVLDNLSKLSGSPELAESDFSEEKSQAVRQNLLRSYCPTQDEYFALHLSLLTQKEPQIDDNSWTIGQESATVDGSARARFFYWDPAGRKVYSVLNSPKRYGDNEGIRPTRRAVD